MANMPTDRESNKHALRACELTLADVVVHGCLQGSHDHCHDIDAWDWEELDLVGDMALDVRLANKYSAP